MPQGAAYGDRTKQTGSWGNTGGGGGGLSGGASLTDGPVTMDRLRTLLGGGVPAATGGVPGANPSPAGGATSADKEIMDRYLANPAEKIPNERAYWDALSHLGKRSNDFMNRGNSILDNIGNMALGSIGIGEMDPTKQALGASTDPSQGLGGQGDNASWGVDPIAAMLSAAGFATGLPLGSLYNYGVKPLTGMDPMVAFDGNNYLGQGGASLPPGSGVGTAGNGAAGFQGPRPAPTAAAPAPVNPAPPGQQGKTVITGSGTVAPSWPWNTVTQ